MQLEQRDNSTFVLFQPSCLKHRYIRNQHDLKEIVERPQRIKAVTAGIASVWSKHEQALKLTLDDDKSTAEEDDELGNLMKGLSIQKKKRIELKGKTSPFDILFSNDQLSIDSPALKMIHSLPNYPPDYSPPPPPPRSPSKKESFPTHSPWPQQLLHLIKQVPPPTPTTTRRESEIPPHLPQGDLYLSPESDQAIFGALGAVCKGVDLIMNNGYDNGFVVIRPPGHHCGESNPQGFCFLNNISIASAHSHLKHGINRVVILDIDLHHGNGTQEIVWKLNEKANQILNSHHEQLQQRRRRSSSPNKSKLKDKDNLAPPDPPRPLQIMYSSLHDVLSYPCESGDPYMISSASIQISGPHQQFIQNTHLEPYSSTSEFFKSKQKEKGEGSEGSEGSSLWEKYWNNLGGKKLLDFLTKTCACSEETLILISCGFDASVHEFSSMSRHSLNVPDKFFKKFAFEISKVGKKVSNGKVLFVLEGGYSDKALSSGSFSVLEGLLLAGSSSSSSDNNLEEEEKEKKVKVKVEEEDEEEDLKDLERILQVCGLDNNNTLGGKKKIGKGGGGSLRENDKEWIKRTKEIFDYLQLQQLGGDNHGEDDGQDDHQGQTPTATDRGGRRQLRERKIRLDYAGLADHSLPLATQQKQHQQQSPLITIPSPPAQSVPPSSTTTTSTTTTTAFSSIPPTSFYSPLPTTATTTTTTQDERNEQGEATEQDREKKNNVNNPPPPAIKFVWKQGGIGGNSNSMSQPRM